MFIDRSNMVEKIYDFDKFADILRRNAQVRMMLFSLHNLRKKKKK